MVCLACGMGSSSEGVDQKHLAPNTGSNLLV